ncbi:MAG: hypothetical protein JWO03_1891 [Bacteroidetes bacterium]|nr:hypothetical protein [Bacteroidota bacterium]
MCVIDLFLYLAGEDVPEHDEIRSEAPQGIGECGGAVFLDEEMTYPGKAIPEDGYNGKKVPFHSDDASEEACDDEPGTDEMQGPVERVRVFSEVVWVECPKAFVFFLCHSCRFVSKVAQLIFIIKSEFTFFLKKVFGILIFEFSFAVQSTFK